jgi:hydroxypyruvate reductase
MSKEIRMSNLTQLRIAAREIFDEALTAVDAGDAVRQALSIDRESLRVCDQEIDLGNRQIFSIAIGKAAAPMAYALEQQIGESFAAGFMSGPLPQPEVLKLKSTLKTRWRHCAGGHPLPTESSLIAAAEAFRLLERANQERAFVIFLVSGGGSAMIESPITDEISLNELRAANKALINCGASIGEINSVRRGFSAVKGGRLSARAPDCDQITLIVSDVPEGEEQNVASGPTLNPPADAPKALDVIARYDLRKQLPETVLRAIDTENAEPVEVLESDLRKHFVLLNNRTALEAAAAAARQRGFIAEIAADVSDQPIRDGCQKLLENLESLRTKHRPDAGVVCLISGGEFACPVTGDGTGGRNLETALRLADSMEPNVRDTVALCAGTDGVDGNSPAAGAIIDNTTITRARSIGLDAKDFLARSDSYSFFVALGDLINTGVTGTNVRDLRILLARTRELNQD